MSQLPVHRQLERVLDGARDRGFLGPGPVAVHLDHSLGFVAAAGRVPKRFLDLGSGGGVPGLVLAAAWDGAQGVLLDTGRRRAAFLREAVAEVGLTDRVTVAEGRAEDLARDPALRGTFDLVVARSFAAPAVTAECSAPFLVVGGLLVVSEPPEGEVRDRWPVDGLQQLGFGPPDPVAGEGRHFVRIPLVQQAADRWPRKTGIPAKRPLWEPPRST